MAATAILLHPSTPPDYHRIISPTLSIPSNPSISIPVGILACQRDPLLKSLTTTIVNCTLSQPTPGAEKSNTTNGKKTKKSVISPPIPDEPILQVLLHDTVIFPEGGGQPTDTGVIINNTTTWEVVQAKRHGGHAVHYVRIPVKDGVTVDDALLAFSPGTKVTVALGEEGYQRRYDHMTMHTSQHLLSALLETHLNLPTLSWSLTTYHSPCYIELPRPMSLSEIISIQNEANKLVFEGRKVHVEVEELDHEGDDGFAKGLVQMTEGGRAVGKGLPQDYTGGVKRVVVIDGVDRNPCCGTHLPSIHNLQLFLLPHTESLSRSSTTSTPTPTTTTNVRLYFLSGPRLITHLTNTHSLLTQTGSILSCGAPLVPERVLQVVEERKKSEKRVGDVESELGELIASGLVRKMMKEGGEGKKGMFAHHLHRNDDSVNPLGFLSLIASSFINLTTKAGDESNPTPHPSYAIVLSSSPSTQTASSTTSQSTVVVLGSDDKIVKDVGDLLKSKLGVRGGGKGVRWSGKFIGVWKEGRESVLIDEILENLKS